MAFAAGLHGGNLIDHFHALHDVGEHGVARVTRTWVRNVYSFRFTKNCDVAL
jgi:hypothetical protein